MKRADFIKQIALFWAGSAFLPQFKLLQDLPFTELRNGMGTFSMQGGTIGWFVTDDAVVVIDSQYPESANLFIEGILNFGGGPEKVLFNTHHHGDHTNGNPVFAENGYRIIGHANVPELQGRSAHDSENQPTVPDTTFEDNFDLAVGSETIRAKYYGPAHTKGDSVIWFENTNIAHMGDLVFNRVYPFVDRDGGALIANWIPLLEQVFKEADSDTLFIFGHANPKYGVTGNRGDILYMRDFLTRVLEYTREGINEGKSREEIRNIQQFDDFPNFISPGDFLSLPRTIDVAYRELTETE